MESNKLSPVQEDPNKQQSAPDSAPEVTEVTIELDELQTRVHNYPDSKWALIQRVCGAALGATCGLLLTYLGNFPSIGMYGTIGAVLIALFVPNLIEKRIKRSVQKGRVALLIALAVWLGAYALIMILRGVPMIQPK